MRHRVVRTLLRLALLAYPRRARGRYGGELAETVIARCRAARGRGGLAVVVLGVRELIGLVAAGLRARGLDRSAAVRAVSAGGHAAKSRIQVRGGSAMSPLMHLHHAARSLRRRPAAAVVAIVTIGLAVGANVAIFAVLEQVLLAPPPFAEPDRLVAVWEENPSRGWHQAQVAAANYVDWRERSRLFSDLAAHADWTEERGLLAAGEPTLVRGNQVTGNYFAVLGVPALHGRTCGDEHTWEGAEPAVVLAYDFWQRRFGGDPGIVGERVVLDDVTHTVLGVMPRDFRYPFPDVDAWLPTAWPRENLTQTWFRRAHGLRVVGRLAPDATAAAAADELAAIAAELAAEYPETNTDMGAGVTPLQEWMVGDRRRPLLIMSAAVAMVLLVACANVANMLLARAMRRRDELALQQALGADRRSLLVQELTQSLWIAAAGAALGLGLGRLALPALAAIRPPELAGIDLAGLELGWPLVAFAVALTAATALLAGLVPAWIGSRAARPGGLVQGTRGGGPAPRTSRATAVLVAAEVALTLPLLVGAGLMVRSLVELRHVDPGFDAESTLVARVVLPTNRYADDPEVIAFYRRALGEVAAIDGVRAVALSSRLPFGNPRWSSDFSIAPAGGEGAAGPVVGGQNVRHDEVSPGHFRTLGVPLLAGRDFGRDDRLDSEPVVIVNRALAERYFPGHDPVGRRVTFDHPPSERSLWRTVVGVVGDVRRETLARREEPSFYAPILQDTTRGAHLLVRTTGEPLAWQVAVRERLAAIDPALPLADLTTLETVVSRSMARERFVLVLLAAFALLALVLAAVGVYGVVAYAAAVRRREMGIRLALGATRRQVFRFVLARNLAPVAVGMLLGTITALALARTLASLLFGVAPTDPATFAAVLLLTAATAVAASSLPTRKAARTDPVTVLRAE